MGYERRGGTALTWVALLATSAGAQGEVVHVITGGGTAGLGLGEAVNGAGDVDGDGLDDLIVGFRYGSGLRAGTAQVISGADGSVLFTFTGSAPFDLFGQSVDGAGDVDGDGHADLVVGAVGEDANGADSGGVHVFSGRDGSELYHFVGDFPRARFGGAVSGAGDIDGDGRCDIFVGGQPDASTPRPNGHARLLSGADGSVLFDFIGPSSSSRLGCAVDAAGDVNGDGVGDLLAGDWWDPTAGALAGSASVFSGADGTLLFEVFGDKSNDRLGLVVSGVGDVNGDGRADVLASAPFADAAVADVGLVRVYSGADASVLYSVHGDAAQDGFGAAASGVGDFDADGAADFAVGAYADDDAGTSAGSVRVYSGADGGVLLRVDGDSPGDLLGFSVSHAGDVTGDGGDDFIIGAPSDDQGGGPASGAAFVLAGATPASSVVRHCSPGPNAFGPGAEIGFLGSTSVAARDFVLTVDGARPKRVGLFFFGAQQQQVPFMKGYLCIARPRYLMGRPIHLDPTGSGQLSLTATSRRWHRHQIVAGSTWNFQFVYLDPPSRRRGPFNFSDALRVTFVP